MYKSDIDFSSSSVRSCHRLQARAVLGALSCAYRSLVAEGLIYPISRNDWGLTAGEILLALESMNHDAEVAGTMAQISFELRRLVTTIDTIETLRFMSDILGRTATGIPQLPLNEAYEGLSESEIAYEFEKRLEILASQLYSLPPVVHSC